jgi:hypothetical protein
MSDDQAWDERDLDDESHDEQAQAEQLDEDVIVGDDELWDGDEEEEYPPDRLTGVPFADADVTDESLADRLEQMEPDLAVPDPEARPTADDERTDAVTDEPPPPDVDTIEVEE